MSCSKFYSAGHLRHMRLSMVGRLSNEGFIESIKKLPHLESLEISYVGQLSKETFEVIGRHCPLLKTLKCFWTVLDIDDVDIDVSVAIAETMPRLQHLKFSGNMPTNEGLLAILDGCPLLESLDLEECYSCFSFGYSESLEKRCREKIKDFRPPNCYFSDDCYSD
ncbi:putative F-box/LRR-repeat protein 22 [Vicia villosa]|uniref:putative F-box/LRR-repeat protein 22 n=1 Tax=Vicia villosa TaxID=3911 RepID=UPI00273B2F03|nr:putative F-box/LRR-repeat protein 22 [Vicia villosa]